MFYFARFASWFLHFWFFTAFSILLCFGLSLLLTLPHKPSILKGTALLGGKWHEAAGGSRLAGGQGCCAKVQKYLWTFFCVRINYERTSFEMRLTATMRWRQRLWWTGVLWMLIWGYFLGSNLEFWGCLGGEGASDPRCCCKHTKNEIKFFKGVCGNNFNFM